MKLRYLLLLIPLSFIILALYNGRQQHHSKFDTTREAMLLRKVVHELLLSCGDSTSRILPAENNSDNEYLLMPENPIAISPDTFVAIVSRAVQEKKFSKAFTANVIQKSNRQTVYSFTAVPLPEAMQVSCLGRDLPKDGYYFSFVFAAGKTGRWQYYLYISCALLTVTGIFYFLQKNKSALKQPENEEPKPGSTENCIPIGRYIFYPDRHLLMLNQLELPLTGKETKILQLLASGANSIVSREVLQKEVWENEGIIVTRSLDMFISKLRKKMQEDPDVKILNVHGRGYKLVVPV
ncbi:MAG TPA: response regulator transcription factor [Ferruginibacter sp.]|nr:response regulator transcription factor [Ferruginibacter sp.]HMP22081.1 response regulator transcription factor [Ferruginibacter sp.]